MGNEASTQGGDGGGGSASDPASNAVSRGPSRMGGQGTPRGYFYGGGGGGMYGRPRAKQREGDPKRGQNYRFYSGKGRHESGLKIEECLATWNGDYQFLERAHNFIQWLFPIFESGGMSLHSEALGKKEAALIRSDWTCNIRFIRSYRLMLNFYGFVLADLSTGRIKRHPKSAFWRERFANNTGHPHNFLRISRILICLGEFGFVRWKQPFLHALTKEVRRGTLRECRDSHDHFWSRLLDYDSSWYQNKTLESEEDREEAVFFALLEERKGVKVPSAFQRALADLAREEEEREVMIENYIGMLKQWRRTRLGFLQQMQLARDHGGAQRSTRPREMVHLNELEPSSSWDEAYEELPMPPSESSVDSSSSSDGDSTLVAATANGVSNGKEASNTSDIEKEKEKSAGDDSDEKAISTEQGKVDNDPENSSSAPSYATSATSSSSDDADLS